MRLSSRTTRAGTGLDLRQSAPLLIDRWRTDHLVELEGRHLLPTLDGMAVADALAAEAAGTL